MVTVSAKNTTPAYLKSNQRAWVEYVECDKTEQCPLYARGRCACYRYLLGTNQTCPNGRWHRKEGYTPRAKKFYDFAVEIEKNYKQTAEEFNDKIAIVADYIYIPLPFLSGTRDDFKGVEDGRIINKNFVKISAFNEDLIEELVKFVPYTWFDYAPIKSYREKEIPIFIQQLKEEIPDIYNKWAEKYPETAKQFKDVSPVGRTAYVSTLPDGCKFEGWTKDGDCITNTSYRGMFGGKFKSRKPLEIRVKINDDMVVEVSDNMKVNTDTKYVD